MANENFLLKSLPLDEAAALRRFMELVQIPGVSGSEGKIAAHVADRLRKLNAGARIVFDQAHRHLGFGECGNLICRLPGTIPGPRRMLSAHLDTVPLCENCKPVRRGGFIRSGDPGRALGADDRAGVGVILTAIEEVIRRKLPYPPLTLLFPVQEELGVKGVRHLAVKELENPKMAFNWDGGQPEKIQIGAIGSDEITVEVLGRSAHGAIHPECGVNALSAAAMAIAELHQGGWIGLVQKPDGEGRTNIGLIEGGLATNIVPARVVLHGEIRSHKPAFRRRQAHVWRKAFEKAAAKIKNNVGLTARIRFQRKAKYESYLLAKTAPSLREAEQALRLLGLAPCRSVSNGGLDVNWLHAHGIPAVSLGDGGGNPHDTKEYLRIRGYLTACRTAMLLIVGTETMRNLHQCP